MHIYLKYFQHCNFAKIGIIAVVLNCISLRLLYIIICQLSVCYMYNNEIAIYHLRQNKDCLAENKCDPEIRLRFVS